MLYSQRTNLIRCRSIILFFQPSHNSDNLQYSSLVSIYYNPYLVDETQNLARNVLSSGLLVVHDARRSGQDHVTKLSGRQQVIGPSLDVADFDVESGGNHSTLVQSAGQLHHNLARSVVVDVLEFANVA